MRPYEIRERKALFIYSSDTHLGPRHEEQWKLSLPVETLLSNKGVHSAENKRQTVYYKLKSLTKPSQV